MSQSATPAIRNEVTWRLKLLKVTAFAVVAIGTATAPSLQMVADGLRTLVDGCERQSSVERTRLHPQTPKVKREPFAYAFGKKAYKPNLWVSHPWPFSGNIHVNPSYFQVPIYIHRNPSRRRWSWSATSTWPGWRRASFRCRPTSAVSMPRGRGSSFGSPTPWRCWATLRSSTGRRRWKKTWRHHGIWYIHTLHYITLHYTTLHDITWHYITIHTCKTIYMYIYTYNMVRL